VLQYQQALIAKDSAHDETVKQLSGEIDRLKNDKNQLEEYNQEEQKMYTEINDDLEKQVNALTQEKESLLEKEQRLQAEVETRTQQAQQDKEAYTLLTEELSLANDKLASLTSELENSSTQLNDNEEQISYNQELIVDLEMKLSSSVELATETQTLLTTTQTHLLETTKALDEARVELAQLQEVEGELTQLKIRHEKAKKELETAERVLNECQSNEASMKHALTKMQVGSKQTAFELESVRQELKSCQSQLLSCQRKAKTAIQAAEDDRLTMKEFEHSSKTHELKCKTLENNNRDLRLKLTEAQREQWERDQILDDFQKQKAATEGRYKAVTQENDSQRKKSKHYTEQISQLQQDLSISRKEVHQVTTHNT
jgi:chromosome segregation ATPase